MDVIKDLEMRSLSFIIYWILNALHVSLEEGGRGRFHLSVYPRGLTAEKDLKVLALRTVVMLSEDKDSCSHQELEEARNRLPPRGSTALLTP